MHILGIFLDFFFVLWPPPHLSTVADAPEEFLATMPFDVSSSESAASVLPSCHYSRCESVWTLGTLSCRHLEHARLASHSGSNGSNGTNKRKLAFTSNCLHPTVIFVAPHALSSGARRRRALARRRRAPTGSGQSHEDGANRGVSWNDNHFMTLRCNDNHFMTLRETIVS